MPEQRAAEHGAEGQQRQHQGAPGQGREDTGTEQHQQVIKAGQRMQQAILQRIGIVPGVSESRYGNQQQNEGQGVVHGDAPYQK
ncbi:hypothetical protein D3C75_1160570 [compost metagenome]